MNSAIPPTAPFRPARSAWTGPGQVLLHDADERSVRGHAAYADAKAGDREAAFTLVDDILSVDVVKILADTLPPPEPCCCRSSRKRQRVPMQSRWRWRADCHLRWAGCWKRASSRPTLRPGPGKMVTTGLPFNRCSMARCRQDANISWWTTSSGKARRSPTCVGT